MTSNVLPFKRPLSSADTLRTAAPTFATGGYLTEYHVTHLAFDIEDGWTIELARDNQTTSSPVRPRPADLPTDVRRALLQFLGVASDKMPA
ncbi:hypothetical protein [Rhodococcoides fascians]|uniref:hypothetical protein n=1 Tax=Rhodococcoides fascians TaxID=1828 RepID=UPI00055B96D0|nr:hypothetical protein [Rhodococcus fascians]